jgi:hypothetical protein
MSTMPLPAKASLSQLRARAKDLRKAVSKGRPDAVERARANHPAYKDPGSFTLRDAQLTVAREYGVASWGELMEKVATELVEGRVIQCHPEQMSDWDEPFAREALARALAATGALTEARAELERAHQLTALVAADGDREVLHTELAKDPWFGLTR